MLGIWLQKNDEHDDPAPVVSYHAFPVNNAELCQKWVRANPRKDFVARLQVVLTPFSPV